MVARRRCRRQRAALTGRRRAARVGAVAGRGAERMTILVTGGSGFIGLNLIEELLQGGRNVVSCSLDALPDAARLAFRELPGRLTEARADVRDAAAIERLMDEHAVERVWHGATITAGVARERENPASIIDTNVLGTLAVLEAARRHGVARFVVVSSAAVYGEAIYGGADIDETAPAVPQTMYGITKLACERLGARWASLWGMDVVAGRIAAVFGPWERDTGLRDTLSPVFQLACQAARGEEAALVRGVGRDWVYSRDVARAFDLLLHTPRHVHEVYNIALGRVWPLERFCSVLEDSFPGFRCRLVDDEAASTIAYNDALERPRSANQQHRLEGEFGLAPRGDLDAALADYAEWARVHADFLRRQP